VLRGVKCAFETVGKFTRGPVPPYRIYYRKSADVFEVVRVYHQARRPIER
jgi:hypothetical protein